jgi:hypothetical protein
LIYYIASVLDPRIKGVWIQREHQNGHAKLAEVQKTIYKLYPSMPPRSPKVDDNLTSNSGINSSSNPLQALFAHLTNNNALESDVDLYFNTLVVKHRQISGNEDQN